LKILFISRATLYKDKGGDTVQVVATEKYLKKLGVEVVIRLCNEKIDYRGFDLIHFFNIIRPADILYHIRKSGKPYVISTIYVNYAEYEKLVRKGIAGLIFRTFSDDFIEFIKVVARSILNGETIISPEYLFWGHRRSIRHIIANACLLLPNSNSEYHRIKAHFHISKRYIAIPNGIDPELFSREEFISEKNKDLVICVGRIEGRKNQLNLIRALKGTDYQLVIIGSASANHQNYYKSCVAEAGPNTSFIENLPQQNLIEYYKKAKVHVLASWFETTGLSSLEAACMGCNVVITDKGDTREYFEEYGYYCNPSSPESIYEAVNKAASSPFEKLLRDKIILQYSWPVTAQKTLEAYQEAQDSKI
jgi:glycosyltransferase involved in cell wall biosynthesis